MADQAVNAPTPSSSALQFDAAATGEQQDPAAAGDRGAAAPETQESEVKVGGGCVIVGVWRVRCPTTLH